MTASNLSRKPSTAHWWVLGALFAGLAIGTWLDRGQPPGLLLKIAGMVESLGALWLNGLRMTVGPLVFSLLVAAVAGVPNAALTGRLAARTLGWFAVLLVLAGILAVLLSRTLLLFWPVDGTLSRAFIAGAGGAAAAVPVATDWGQWLQSVLPPNIIAAAADNAILALVVFALLFGFATTRLAPQPRALLTGFFGAMAEAMVVIVHWVLLAAPVGVFALALGVGRQAGLGAAGLLAHYALFVALVIAVATLAIYVVVAFFARSPGVRPFASSIAPVQVVAASTQSSLATLPAMIECARDRLDVSSRVAGLVLPLAVAVFRYTSPLGNLAVCFFVAAMYGLEPSLLQVGAGVFVALAVSVGSVGLPGQVSFVASVAPICLVLGVPVEVLGILVAVEIVPDIFRTIGNVTADLAVVTLVREPDDESAATDR
jgi:proton glutamate symport protein